MNKIEGSDAGGGVYRWNPEAGRYWLESRNPNWESIETRACVIIENEKFGKVALLPIGMSQICSVNFVEGIEVGSDVQKGQELGYFLFGGSDFVIVFQKGVKFKLKASTKKHIFFGEKLGELKK
jgi:phosphatidylserine decarboxylase